MQPPPVESGVFNTETPTRQTRRRRQGSDTGHGQHTVWKRGRLVQIFLNRVIRVFRVPIHEQPVIRSVLEKNCFRAETPQGPKTQNQNEAAGI